MKKKCGSDLENMFSGIIETDDEVSPMFEFNKEVLNYACVIDSNSEFASKIFFIGLIIVLIIMIVSIAVIYTSFEMTFNERTQEYGMLSALGMSKKQKNIMALKEAFILGIIGIPIGIIFGILYSKCMIYFLDKLVKTTIYDVNPYRILNMNIDLTLNFPLFMLLLVVFIVYVIIVVSSMLPMTKNFKFSQIEQIRKNRRSKANKKRDPKLIKKVFSGEAYLAYKYIRREKGKYKAIVISITISIILFLTISSFITNTFAEGTSVHDYDYSITLISDEKDYEENKKDIFEYLQNNNYIDSYYIELASGSFAVNTDKMSETLNKMIQNNFFGKAEDVKWKGILPVQIYEFSDDIYTELLKRAGVEKLEKGEVIITNNVSNKTKYAKNGALTKLKVGDTYEVEIAGMEIERYKKTYKIAGIVDDFEDYIKMPENKAVIMQLMSKEDVYELQHEHLTEYKSVYANIRLITDKALELDDKIGKKRRARY